MELLEAILCCICVGTFALLGITFLITTICSLVKDKKQEKKNEAWEAEKQQMERDRAIREVEYHEARMKELESR